MTDIVVLSPITPDVIKMVRESVGVNEERIAEAKEQLRQWLERQPYLPHCIGKYCFPLPNLNDNGDRVMIGGYFTPDTEKYSAILILKLTFMVLDIMLLEDYAVGGFIVLDCKDMKMGHAACFTPPVLRNLVTTVLNGFSYSVKGVLFMNAPSYVVPIVNLVRTMVKPKIAKRIFVDGEGYGVLHKHISRKILPCEFQGEAGSIKDMWGAWMKKLHCYRSWFLEEEKFKADESKRFEQLPNRYTLFGSDGSFRQLNID